MIKRITPEKIKEFLEKEPMKITRISTLDINDYAFKLATRFTTKVEDVSNNTKEIYEMLREQLIQEGYKIL